MKYVKALPIMLMVWPYVLIFPILSGILRLPFFERMLAPVGIYYLPVTAALALVSLCGSLILSCVCKIDAARLAYWNQLIKLVHIPFYLFAFAFGLFVPIAIPFVFLIDAVLLISSSCYGIAALVRAGQAGEVSAKFAWINGFCHLLFAVDVVSARILYRKLKAGRK